MKQYIYGLVAVALAISLRLFSLIKKFKKQTTYTFQYTKITYTKSEVELKTNWNIAAGETCANANVKACQITVRSEYTEINAQGVRVLKTTGPNQVTIVAQASSVCVYYVNVTLSINIQGVVNKP